MIEISLTKGEVEEVLRESVRWRKRGKVRAAVLGALDAIVTAPTGEIRELVGKYPVAVRLEEAAVSEVLTRGRRRSEILRLTVEALEALGGEEDVEVGERTTQTLLQMRYHRNLSREKFLDAAILNYALCPKRASHRLQPASGQAIRTRSGALLRALSAALGMPPSVVAQAAVANLSWRLHKNLPVRSVYDQYAKSGRPTADKGLPFRRDEPDWS